MEQIFVANSHDELLLFTNEGNYYRLKVHLIEETTRRGRGSNVRKLLGLSNDSIITAVIIYREKDSDNKFVTTCTGKGYVKKTPLSEYATRTSSGVKALTVGEKDFLGWAEVTDGGQEILITTSSGRLVRFDESDVRSSGRTSRGVCGVSIDPAELVVAFCTHDPSEEKDVLTVSERGLGKRSRVEDYRKTSRAAKGVKAMQIDEKTGSIVDTLIVDKKEDVIVLTKKGRTVRQKVSRIKLQSRATKGVKMVKLEDSEDSIVDVTVASETKTT